MSGAPVDAVLVVAFGGPGSMEEVRPFLKEVLRGHPVPPERFEQVVGQYREIGGVSPLNEITGRQAEGLKRALAAAGHPLPVYVGMRNWHPFLEETLKRMAADGVRRAAGVILAAHRSEASVNRYTTRVEEARARAGEPAPEVSYVEPWFDHPGFVEAIAARIREALAPVPEARRSELSWIFTAHSIPVAMAQRSTYVRDLTATIELVAERFGRPSWRLAYQSRSGDPRTPWLEPDIRDALAEERARGATGVLAVPVGFVADHVEVLFDLDRGARERAGELGLAFVRAPTVGDHPGFLAALADRVLGVAGAA